MGNLEPHLIHRSLGSPESSSQTASLTVQLFLQGHSVTLVIDRQTDRPTDHANRSVTIDRTYVGLRSTAMRLKYYSDLLSTVLLASYEHSYRAACIDVTTK